MGIGTLDANGKFTIDYGMLTDIFGEGFAAPVTEKTSTEKYDSFIGSDPQAGTLTVEQWRAAGEPTSWADYQETLAGGPNTDPVAHITTLSNVNGGMLLRGAPVDMNTEPVVGPSDYASIVENRDALVANGTASEWSTPANTVGSNDPQITNFFNQDGQWRNATMQNWYTSNQGKLVFINDRPYIVGMAVLSEMGNEHVSFYDVEKGQWINIKNVGMFPGAYR